MGDHPVKVPAELFTEWLSEALLQHDAKSGTVAAMVADRAAQWSADQELEACVEWIAKQDMTWTSAQLRAARRPSHKPPSLAEQALEQYEGVEDILRHHGRTPAGCIRAALNRLAELEANQ